MATTVKTLNNNIHWEKLKLVTGKGHRVLVVEDDSSSLAIWKYVLERVDVNYICDFASDAPEAENLIAMAEAKNHPYDVIISDVYISGSETGIDLWKKYKEKFKGKFLLVSSIDYLNITKLFGHSGGPQYIRKPLQVESCIEAIYEMLKPKK